MFFIFARLIVSIDVKDPDFSKQFTINNNGTFFYGIKDMDINIKKVWESFKGEGVHINIIDNGCYYNHSDLEEVFDLAHSWNYNTNSNDPSPNTTEQNPEHGTVLAGIIGARANDICSIGVAFKSSISCTNLGSNAKQNFIDSIDRNNDAINVKLFGKPVSCINGKCTHEDRDKEIYDHLDKAPENVSFVTSSGIDAKHGGDTNFFSLLSHPRVCVITDITNRGVKSAWSNHGYTILASAPAGGSSSFDSILEPSVPGLGIKNPKDRIESVNPQGIGAAVATGVIGLINQIKPKLTWRDIQAIIALTSRVINPRHPSWVLNHHYQSLNISYSEYYGFGMIDSEQILKVASEWKPLEQQISTDSKITIQLPIPTLRHGGATLNFNITSKIEFIETVELDLSISIKNFSYIRFVLTSPSGISANLKTTYLTNGKRTLQFLMRNFFGELASGAWKLDIISDSACDQSDELSDASIRINGVEKFENIEIPPPRVAEENPYEIPIENKMKIEMTKLFEDDDQCGSPYSLKVISDTDTSVDLYFSDENRNSMWPIHDNIKTNSTLNITIPCIFKDKSLLRVIAHNLPKGMLGETTITIANKYAQNDLYFVNPKSYEDILLSDTKEAVINVNLAMNLPYLIDGPYGQHGLASIIDYQTKEVLLTQKVCLASQFSLHYKGQRCPQCLLSVVPNWHPTDVYCRNIIQPIVILDQNENYTGEFGIDLVDTFCKIPPGVIVTNQSTPSQSSTLPPRTPSPSNSDGNKQQSSTAMIVGCVFLATFAIGLALFFYCFRNREYGSSIISSYNNNLTDSYTLQ